MLCILTAKNIKYMKILISPDSFKDCLSAKAIAENLKIGFEKVSNLFEIRIVPMADGGEGTVNSIIEAANGELKTCFVKDALLRKKETTYGIIGDRGTAVIEMASASGIELLTKTERNPWVTATYGTGQLIKDALDNNCRRIIIGIGGSATIDGGVGMAMALGVRFLNREGLQIQNGGGAISELITIDISDIDNRLAETEIIVACDVSNPLIGSEGASYVYGAQKGADMGMINKLDNNLAHLANIVKITIGKDLESMPGSGAAGGLGFGLMAFCGGRLENGVSIVASEIELERHCKWADVIITGEGKIDFQTKYGKTPQGVADIAGKYNKPVVAVAGILGEGYNKLYETGFTALFSIIDKPMSLEESILKTPELLINMGRAIGNMLLFDKAKE